MVITQKGALPLVEMDDCAVHQYLMGDSLGENNLHSEVPYEDVLKHPCFRGLMGVALIWAVSESIPVSVIDEQRAAWLLKAQVMSNPRRIRVISKELKIICN